MPSLRLILPLLTLALLALAGCTREEATSSWPYESQVRTASSAAPDPAGTGASEHSPVDEGAASEGAPTPSPADGTLGAIEVRAFDLGFDPSALEVAEPGRYRVALHNDGAIFHDLVFDDGTVLEADPGQTVEAEVIIPATGQAFICSVPGHSAAGMAGVVRVAGSEAAAAEGSSRAESSTDDTYADDHGGPDTAKDVAADPDAPAPVLHDPVAPPLLEGDVHEIDLTMTEETMTVAPGFVQQVWTFGGSVPGPVIRVKVGDTIRIRLVNAPENRLHHSIDFHSSQVAWNDEMRSIAPGEELSYEWTADYAGVWMYHCGTAPTLHHIANGMYGMVIVEPAEGLPPVDAEFALVQSEWYLGPQGDITSLEKAMAANPAPDFVVFNGVADQYATAPLEVETGKRVRMYVLNAGPSLGSSFHVVGTIFDTVIKEGVALLPGNAGSWGSQAVALAPAQGAIIEFTTAEDGFYPIVTHAFNHVVRGAQGLIKAGDGDPTD